MALSAACILESMLSWGERPLLSATCSLNLLVRHFRPLTMSGRVTWGTVSLPAFVSSRRATSGFDRSS